MAKKWPGQDTAPPGDLIAHYQKDRTWERTRYFYETWRNTTAMVDPPSPFDNINPRIQVALCAVAQAMIEDALEMRDLLNEPIER